MIRHCFATMWSVLLVSSFLVLGFCAVPPLTWQENWFDHDQLVRRHYYDSDVAVYFDKDVDKSITWMNTFLHDIWVHIKKVYGRFGADPHLYVIFHEGKYEGCHITTYFDAKKSYRNVADFGSKDKDAWVEGRGQDFMIGCIGLIIQNSMKGVHDSPHFSVCGHQWTEILTYDLYLGINREEDAQRWYDLKINATHNHPRAGTYWFRDWFYPIYEYGGSKILNRFFELIAEHFPRNNSSDGSKYARQMNFGEFVHFWSGATRINLKAMATQAFGWNKGYERELQQARKDFANVMYYNIIL